MPEESGIAPPNPSAWLSRPTRSILGETGICAAAARMCFIKKPS